MPRATARHRWIAPISLVATTGFVAFVLIVDTGLTREEHVLLVLSACAAYVVMTIAEPRWGGLSIRLVAITTVSSCVASVAVFPRATGDLFWYAIYGRIAAVYRSNPYTHVPAAFPHDPLLRITGQGWAHVPSVYGPLFTAFSAAIAPVLGVASLPTRLTYQLVAAGALLAACAIIWRRTRSAGAVAFLAANPVVAIYLVNGGRNDILVGLAMLGAVVLSTRGRDTAAGVVGGLGALVKLTGLVGVVALVVSTFVTRGRASARRIGLAAVAVVGTGYLFVGSSALFTPMKTAGAAFSSASVWRVLVILGHQLPTTHVALAFLALATSVVILGFADDPPADVTASLTALTLGAAYMLPGYVGWSLPTAALDPKSRVSRVAAAAGVLLVASYEIVREHLLGPVGAAVARVNRQVAPVVVLALLAVLVVAALQARLAVRRLDRVRR